MIDSLPQDHSQPRRAHRMKPYDLCALAIQKNSAQKFGGVIAVPLPIQRYLVLFFDLESRMSELLGEIAVVRQEQQSLALRVQASNIEKARELWREQIENGIARMWIASRRNNSGRLVQRDRQLALEMHDLPVNFDVIALVRLRAEVGANAAVNCDPAGRDQLITLSTRTNARRGEIAIQTHAPASPKDPSRSSESVLTRPASFSADRLLCGLLSIGRAF